MMGDQPRMTIISRARSARARQCAMSVNGRLTRPKLAHVPKSKETIRWRKMS